MKKLLYLLLSAAMVSCGNVNEKTAEISTENVNGKDNIYEVNIRQYTQEGTFKAFEDNHLERLKEQNVDILWLMPIFPISEEGRKGTLGSYYAVKNYTEVNPEFGTLNDLQNLVNHAHKLGMKVILDWVANHTGKDNVWTKEHKDFYNLDSLGNPAIPEGTDWDDVADLNYDNPQMRKAMIEAMKFWLKNADIDGFRCDVAGMVPTDFWVECRKELETVKKPIFMLAEDDKPEIHKAFDASYNWKLHHVLNKIAQGKNTADSLAALILKEEKDFQKNDILMNFTSNHDENSWSKSEYDRMGDYVKSMAVLTYFLPGMPLCYSGQEAANRKALEFFEKDVIDFSNVPLKDFYAELNKTKHSHSALWNNDIKIISSNDNVFVFERQSKDEKILCIFNFNEGEKEVSLEGGKNIKVEGKGYKIMFE
ncbi:MAG: alpha-glucosidase C-terminal domain-containing protein [Bacteroidales bacterium]|nr:alpha-glucosidase C-terminal domain-containing protein [Bacteroidales bacterium]